MISGPKCPWCGCVIYDPHPECVEAAKEQYEYVLRLQSSMRRIVDRDVTYIGPEVRLDFKSQAEAIAAFTAAREALRSEP